MQVCTLLQTDNHASTPPLSFLQAGCPPCHPTNSVKALKAQQIKYTEAVLSNSTRKLLSFEITKMLIAVVKNTFVVLFFLEFLADFRSLYIG